MSDTQKIEIKKQPPRGGFGPGGHMMGMPAEKSKNFKDSFKRLASYMKPQAEVIALVLVMGIASVGFTILGPKMLGKATNYVFEGAISKNLPAGASKAQVVAGLQAKGQTRMAEMLSHMNIKPGQGVDFQAVQSILLMVGLIYLLSRHSAGLSST